MNMESALAVARFRKSPKGKTALKYSPRFQNHKRFLLSLFGNGRGGSFGVVLAVSEKALLLFEIP